MNKLFLKMAAMLIVVVLLTGNGQAADENGAALELTVRQKPAGVDKYFEIIRDTVDIALGIKKHLTLVNMNIDLELESIDSQYVSFTTYLTTMGRDIYNESQRFKIEYNLPGRIDHIPGKAGSEYQLLISPREKLKIDTTECALRISKDYSLDPTANFDLYYVKGSLGDYGWSEVKSYLEYDYPAFKQIFQLTTSSKASFYLCPCMHPELEWDDRFGFAIDVGRSNVYALYNHSFSGVDIIVANMQALLRLWGYAPPILVEGISGYTDFSKYKMKKLIADGKTTELENLLTSRGYYGADPITAEVSAISFCRFLLDSYGLTKMKNLYEMADDLTLKSYLPQVYGMSLDSLESEWRHYADTVEITREEIDINSARMSVTRRFDEQLEYIELLAEHSANHTDSLDAWKKLSSMYYQIGDYYKAFDAYQTLIKIDDFNPQYIYILGTLKMINGEYDEAYKYFDSVYALDYTYTHAKLMEAEIMAIRGDSAKALKLAEETLPREKQPLAQLGFLIFIADIYSSNGPLKDSAKAEEYYTNALILAQRLEAKAPTEIILKLRAGQALVGLGEYEKALYYLDIATFAEIRSFYVCKALLALGMAHDGMGERDAALEYYRLALATPITDYDRLKALRYIDKPYGK